MFLGILTLITALCISAVAIYYSVAGLMTIFAAAALPIMIMGGTLEIAKLVTAVWLHKYWKQATWWIKTYLTTAVIVLMFITSMGIFGFLSKAHIEQTASADEGIAQLERIETEIARQNAVIVRAEQKIVQLESSGSGADANIQAQIDKEQERIDRAFERIQPAIQQQNQIIDDARGNDATRTKPYEDQLASIQAEVLRLETSAREYETSITELSTDNSAVEPLLAQIAGLEEEIIRVTNQLNSGERDQIRAGQAIIGVSNDGLFGGNTRTALAAWVSGQRERIAQIQSEVSQVRQNAQTTVDAERERLAGVIKDIRERQIPALKERELTMLGKIDEVRQTESPAIAIARNEIQRLRESAEAQVAQSQTLIERLRGQLAQTDKAEEIDAQVDEQNTRIREANTTIDTLTEQRYTLEAEYRKLEAEVGPIKYIAEFIYGETADTNLLEEAVRWVILIIIFVFDPLAVLLLIASQYTFELNRKRKDDQKELLRQQEWEEYERQRAQRIVDNPGVTFDDPVPTGDANSVDNASSEDEGNVDDDTTSREVRAGHNGGDTSSGMALAGGGELNETTTKEKGSGDTTEGSNRDGLTPGTYTGDTQSVPMEQEEDSQQIEKGVEDATADTTTTDDDNGDVIPEDDTTDTDDSVTGMEQAQVQPDELSKEQVVDSYIEPSKKKELELLDESEEVEILEERKQQWEEKESDLTLSDAKTKWKIDHPNETIKFYKVLYLKGKIDKLPWEKYKSDLAEEAPQEGYIQNSEQNESTLFNRLRRESED